ncbi:uncharacterized protein LOC129018965 isoform X2 [Pongo pygmaeus]|uniref:uncharacterized protein LOC129018965 isoform X2 n=1 Tax=Pongo pygmaeus TaxID=9600 RepID=UPI0023E12100|nr:uncharacterized protein LOC129018965 isoform X2 [Pongo pygmaeus]
MPMTPCPPAPASTHCPQSKFATHPYRSKSHLSTANLQTLSKTHGHGFPISSWVLTTISVYISPHHVISSMPCSLSPWQSLSRQGGRGSLSPAVLLHFCGTYNPRSWSKSQDSVSEGAGLCLDVFISAKLLVCLPVWQLDAGPPEPRGELHKSCCPETRPEVGKPCLTDDQLLAYGTLYICHPLL